MAFMDNTKVTFNGVDLYKEFNLLNVSVGGKIKHQHAAKKNIITSRPLYKQRNTITGFNREPLTFNLTFGVGNLYEDIDENGNIAVVPPNSITEDYCTKLFKILDVDTYKPLRFGDDEMYYNAIPYVGSVTELELFCNNQGYFTIPFVCDAGHGWVDVNKTFKREESTIAQVWNINNPCNVKDWTSKCRVYPYMVLTIPKTTDYFSIRLKMQADIEFDEGRITEEERTRLTEPYWFTLENLGKGKEMELEKLEGDTYQIIIDNENKQFFSEIGDNLLQKIKPDGLYNFWLEEGENTIFHRNMQGKMTQAFYDCDFSLSCPVSR